jgi:hypothetical protein
VRPRCGNPSKSKLVADINRRPFRDTGSPRRTTVDAVPNPRIRVFDQPSSETSPPALRTLFDINLCRSGGRDRSSAAQPLDNGRSRPRSGRPRIPVDIRHLILEMSVANPLWGAPQVHGELLKLGVDVGQTTVAKYMTRRRRTVARLEDLPSQSCRWYRVNRPVCRPHDFVSAVVCASGPAAFAAGACMVGRDGTSKCRMDCPSINRGLRLE